jgi:DNA-binding PadR family transcriptional regulator
VELRFAEPSVLILASLCGGPKHGYALIQDVEELSGTRLGPGTLYGAIARLEKEGLVVALPSEDRRRPYEITSAGMKALRTYLENARRVVHAGLTRLGPAT